MRPPRPLPAGEAAAPFRINLSLYALQLMGIPQGLRDLPQSRRADIIDR